MSINQSVTYYKRDIQKKSKETFGFEVTDFLMKPSSYFNYHSSWRLLHGGVRTKDKTSKQFLKKRSTYLHQSVDMKCNSLFTEHKCMYFWSCQKRQEDRIIWKSYYPKM